MTKRCQLALLSMCILLLVGCGPLPLASGQYPISLAELKKICDECGFFDAEVITLPGSTQGYTLVAVTDTLKVDLVSQREDALVVFEWRRQEGGVFSKNVACSPSVSVKVPPGMVRVYKVPTNERNKWCTN